jgi:hypothetical protein
MKKFTKGDVNKALIKIRRRSQEPTEETTSNSNLWGTLPIANTSSASK